MSKICLPAVIALSHLKNAEPKHKRLSVDKMTQPVYILFKPSTFRKNFLRFPRPYTIHSFNESIREMFLADYYSLMDLSIKLDPNTLLVDHTKSFMKAYDLSIDDVNEQTLLRNYRRIRQKSKNQKCEIAS